MLLSNNAHGFTSKVLTAYLAAHGIKHIFRRFYHQQIQSKIEQQGIEGKVCLMVYCSPEVLRKATDETITTCKECRPPGCLCREKGGDITDFPELLSVYVVKNNRNCNFISANKLMLTG
jgi:hypothetical protein